MNESFWLRTRRGVEGPVSRERVVQLVTRNQLGSMDEISSDGRTWTRIRRTEFWGGTRRVTPAPAMVPMPAAKADDPVLQADPTARADKPNSMSRTSDSVSRIEISATSGRRTWKLPTLEEEQRGKNPDNSVSHAKRNAIVACAIGCILLAVVLSSISGKNAVPEPETPAETNTPPEPKATRPESTRSEVSDEGETSFAPVDPDYHGTEIGAAADMNDFKPWARPIVAYLTPNYSELLQIMNTILAATYVTDNADYHKKSKDIRLNHYPADDRVNAFASPFDEQKDELHPTMVILGGAGRFARLVGAIVATEELDSREDINRYRILIKELSAFVGENDSVSIKDMCQILDDCDVSPDWFANEVWIAKAKNASQGVLMGVMAHETGHICLGHISTSSRTFVASKEQERQADSFAQCIASGSAYLETMFWGQFYFHLILALQESANGDDTTRSHPFSEERLRNLIRSNPELAKHYKFTEESIKRILANLKR